MLVPVHYKNQSSAVCASGLCCICRRSDRPINKEVPIEKYIVKEDDCSFAFGIYLDLQLEYNFIRVSTYSVR